MLIPLLVQKECLYIGNNLIILPHKYDTFLNVGDAELYATMFNIGYYDGWRLPNRDELHYLHAIDDFLPIEYRHNVGIYWTTCDSNDEYYVVNMGRLKNTDVGWYTKKLHEQRYDVRLIRNLV